MAIVPVPPPPWAEADANSAIEAESFSSPQSALWRSRSRIFLRMKRTAMMTRPAPTRPTTVKVAPTAPLFAMKPWSDDLESLESSDVVWLLSTEADWVILYVGVNNAVVGNAVVPRVTSVRLFMIKLVFELLVT